MGASNYGLVNGAPQIWEINTNPTIVHRPTAVTLLTKEQQSLLAPVRDGFLHRCGAALEKIDSTADSNRLVRAEVSETERRELKAERELKLRLRARKTAISRLHPAFLWHDAV